MTLCELKHTIKMVNIWLNTWEDCFVALWLRGVHENARILNVYWFSWRNYMHAHFILNLKLHIVLCYIQFKCWLSSYAGCYIMHCAYQAS